MCQTCKNLVSFAVVAAFLFVGVTIESLIMLAVRASTATLLFLNEVFGLCTCSIWGHSLDGAGEN